MTYNKNILSNYFRNDQNEHPQMNAENVVIEYVCVTIRAFIILISKLYVYSRVNEDPTLEFDIVFLSLFMLLSICNPVLKKVLQKKKKF